MTEDEAWALERRFWLEGAEHCEERLDPGCLMAFPGAGVMRAGAVLESLRGAPRWSSVEIADRALARCAENILVLGYAATARREGVPEPYRCLCTSTYHRTPGGWTLVQHQQTPVVI